MRPILLIIVLLFSAWAGQAQSPPGINYQGIARDPDGKPISQKEISIRIGIAKDNADGDAEYAEVHSVTTNSFGLFTLVIGGGSVQTGDFQSITWAVGNKWLKVEMDPDGGNAFKLMGSQQLMSVPYAFYSKYAGNAPSVTQDLSLSGNKLKVTNNPTATNIDLAPYLDNTDAQTLTLNGSQLSISGGSGKVDLAPFLDDTDKQDLTLTGNTLSLTNDATAVDLGAYNQDLKLTGNTLGLVNAPTTIDLAPYNQDLKLTGNTLGLVNAPTTIDLTPYKDNTDNQDLTLSGNTLSLTNDATSVSLAPYNQDLKLTGNTLGLVNAPTTVDLTPYKQDLTLTGNTLGLQNAPSTVDLAPYNEDLKLTGNTLGLVNAPTTIDLTPYKDNTDSQNLSLTTSGTNRTITISGGNNVTIDVADNDNNVTNEIQDLSLSGNTLSLSSDPTSVNLATYNQDLKLTGNTLGLINAPTTVDLTTYLDNTDNQTISNVLTQGNDAGGQKITNLGTPTANSDAATKQYIDTKIAANYAFKATYSYTQLLGTGNDVSLALTSTFDDFNVVGASTFTAAVAGTYLFVLDGGINNILITPSVNLLYNGTKYPVTISSTNGRYNSTFMFRLTAGQTVSVVADNLAATYSINGSFYGYKLL